jgi:membrane protein YqaA with SNARE-associated domain
MFDWGREATLGALFASSFLSATVLPGNSELVLFQVLRADPQSFVAALVVATVGNTLGSMTTFALGRLVPGRGREDRAAAWLRRHGAPVLALAWLPVIGDALCAAAGWLRVSAWTSLVFIALGKLLRYVAVAQAAQLL